MHLPVSLARSEANGHLMPSAQAAYAARAHEYADAFGAIDGTAQPDRDLITRWATRCQGLMADVGCGPGQWTALLNAQGHAIVGIEPVAEFVAIARQRYPDVDYQHGSIQHLPPATYHGILAWYSLIHIDPTELPGLLTTIRRSLLPHGRLLAGFFTGSTRQRFDHAITPAWFWPTGEFCAAVECAGFTIDHVETRHDDGARPHAAVAAHLF